MANMERLSTQWPAEIMEKYQWLDEELQNQRGTEKEFQDAWQAYKYMLRGKMYAYVGVQDKNGRPIITVKLEPVFSEMLRKDHADIVPGYYMNKVHWSTLYLDGEVPREVIADMIQSSYKLMLSSLSKKVQKEILEG